MLRYKIVLLILLLVLGTISVSQLFVDFVQTGSIWVRPHISFAEQTENPIIRFLITNEWSVESVQILAYASIIIISIVVGLLVTTATLRPIRHAVEMQKRFIGSVAHELRTPLAILKTQNEVAKMDADSNSPIMEILNDNVSEIDHMTYILNNLLLFNRVDTAEVITMQPIDLSAVLTTAVEQLEQYAISKNVTIQYVAPSPLRIQGNATGLEQAFFNIIKNGINYTKPGGAIAVEGTDLGDKGVRVSISDTGIGMARHEVAHIFEPFFRTDAGQVKSRGTGLGLAIVYEVIKLHKGRVEVESEKGVGTTFYIHFPRLQVVNEEVVEVSG